MTVILYIDSGRSRQCEEKLGYYTCTGAMARRGARRESYIGGMQAEMNQQVVFVYESCAPINVFIAPSEGKSVNDVMKSPVNRPYMKVGEAANKD